ncbi:PspA/IM30 family protein [Carboxydochorda subterranea]|uniref:PspA/IM30 family protein n=1 Tax=Carboxydichorda subterranea TaxID=3109565 RepID=A0ABZ1BYE2_9FIRM|nr:PspA/IM30 family protein [Limnochorda sp. L945t]WRP17829.1 PspA/IM30 family protein [Limnochorda sp. L945t]
MGVFSRMTTILKAKMNKLAERLEDPRETLEYSYQRQLELMQKVRRNLAEVVTSKKRLELQVVQLKQTLSRLEEQAKQALKAGREDLAVAALNRKAEIQQQIEGIEAQARGLEEEQKKLEVAESRLRAKVEAFRAHKEVVKAQYSAAEAQVRIGEAATGLSEELADVGMAIERAQQKTENMKARAAAIDELVASGVLEDRVNFGAPSSPVEQELAKLKASEQVKADLARLKQEVGQA